VEGFRAAAMVGGSLAQPLLNKNANKQEAEVGSTVSATVINLLKNMVGAGLLNVCVAFQYASVMGGLLIMLFSAFVCTGGFLLIGYCCSKTDAKTFRELWRQAMGPETEKTVDVVLHCLLLSSTNWNSVDTSYSFHHSRR